MQELVLLQTLPLYGDRGQTNYRERNYDGDDDKFDRVLVGTGSAKEIADVIDCRINMDGAKPPGSKVGLIDE